MNIELTEDERAIILAALDTHIDYLDESYQFDEASTAEDLWDKISSA